MENKLKKCVCGNEEIDLFSQNDNEGGFEFVVMCFKCKRSVNKYTKEKAIEAWNRRADEE